MKDTAEGLLIEAISKIQPDRYFEPDGSRLVARIRAFLEQERGEADRSSSEAAPSWKRLPDDAELPDGPPTEAGKTLYTFDQRGTWVYECPPLPGDGYVKPPEKA